MVDSTVILAGAVPSAAMALAADGLLGMLERRARRPGQWTWRGPAAAIAVFLVVAGAVILRGFSTPHAVVVGSKNFTEQFVLGELIAQTLERYGGLTVDRRLNLGGTFICDRALRAGDIDVYVEYTGTALTAVFKQAVGHDRAQVLDAVRQQYAASGRTMLAPLGFNNTFADPGARERCTGTEAADDYRCCVGRAPLACGLWV